MGITAKERNFRRRILELYQAGTTNVKDASELIEKEFGKGLFKETKVGYWFDRFDKGETELFKTKPTTAVSPDIVEAPIEDSEARAQLRLLWNQLKSLDLAKEGPIDQEAIDSLATLMQEFLVTGKAKSLFNSDHIILDTSYWGQKNEAEIDSELLTEKRKFSDLYVVGGCLMAWQQKQEPIYRALTDRKKLIFHYFFELSENLMKYPEAQEEYQTYRRAQMLRVSNSLADISNFPTSPDDCFIANDALMIDSKTKGTRQARPNIYFCPVQIDKFAAKFACILIKGPGAITPANGLQASHKCGQRMCVRPTHVIPEKIKENASRKPCHRLGCAATCPHDDPCSFHTEEGVYIPCRNDKSLKSCKCGKRCFDGVNIEEAEMIAADYRANKEKPEKHEPKVKKAKLELSASGANTLPDAGAKPVVFKGFDRIDDFF